MKITMIQKSAALAIVGFSIITLGISCKSAPDKKEVTEETPKEAQPTSIVEKINAAGEINVGFEPDAPPLYFEKSGKKMGFDYELINYLSKEVFDGVKINTIEDGYDNLPKTLKDGKIDIMAGGRTNEESDDQLYSDPYLSFGYCLLTTPKSSKTFKNLESLANSKIGVYDDYTAEWLKGKVPSAKVSVIGDREDENTPESDWMSALPKGELDAIIYDFPFAANEILDYSNKIVITNKNLNGEELSEYVLVVNKSEDGAEELIQKINKGIQKYKETTNYADAIVNYIPSGVSQEPKESASTNTYAIKRGETLSIIARDHLGDMSKWSDIYSINKDRLASPDIIYPGQNILKPEGWQ